MTDLVVTSLNDGVFRITLNDPAQLNSMTGAMTDAVREGLLRAQAEARVVVLAGAGKAFCAGANLNDVLNDPIYKEDGGLVLEKHYNPLVRTIRDLTIPLITSVRGAAVGVGASLALAGDIIITSETAYFLHAFRYVGLAPDGGSPYLLTRAIGRVRAAELLLLGEKLPAAKALDWGLVTRLVADAELEASVDAIAANLASGATFALGQSRRMIWAATEGDLEQELQRERTTQREAATTLDFKEGVAAFIEKRKPAFIGH